MILKIKKLLESLKLPVAYGSFKKKTLLPYAIIISDGQDYFLADGKIYAKKNTYRVELYSAEKAIELEEEIERTFIENGIIYEKSADIITEENVYAVYYFIRGSYNNGK